MHKIVHIVNKTAEPRQQPRLAAEEIEFGLATRHTSNS